MEDGNHKVIATARGFFDQTGGALTSEETGVSVIIPPGALGRKQEIYFKVCQDSSLIPPLDQEKGEFWLLKISCLVCSFACLYMMHEL